jgi:hypothetical protein
VACRQAHGVLTLLRDASKLKHDASKMTKLKEASMVGIPDLADPEGKKHTVFPMLMSYVTDDPEAKDISACKSGNLPASSVW